MDIILTDKKVKDNTGKYKVFQLEKDILKKIKNLDFERCYFSIYKNIEINEELPKGSEDELTFVVYPKDSLKNFSLFLTGCTKEAFLFFLEVFEFDYIFNQFYYLDRSTMKAYPCDINYEIDNFDDFKSLVDIQLDKTKNFDNFVGIIYNSWSTFFILKYIKGDLFFRCFEYLYKECFSENEFKKVYSKFPGILPSSGVFFSEDVNKKIFEKYNFTIDFGEEKNENLDNLSIL